MGETTKIAWADATFNIAWGCTKIDPGCKHCYAETLSKRYGHDVWGPSAPRRVLSKSYWHQPVKWDSAAQACGTRPKVFTSSMCDVFEDHPTITEQRERLWPLIRETPNLDWQILTKRADRIAANLPPDWDTGYPNVWLGVSVSEINGLWRLDELRKVPARVRFLSYEPALGPIAETIDLLGISWVIYGGESGPNFRPEQKHWARDMRERCILGDVAFFHKQSAGPRPGTGVELDGKIIQEFPR